MMNLITGLLALCLPFTLIADPTLTVTGIGKVEIEASLAHLSLSVEKEAPSAEAVHNEVAQAISPVLAVARRLEVEDLETGSASIYPVYSKDERTQVIGYKGQQQIRFHLPVDRAGAAIDTLIKAGANRLDSIRLKPTQELLRAARDKALRFAVDHAIAEGDVVLKALGRKRKEIVKVVILSDGNFIPYAAEKRAMFTYAEAAQLEVLPEQQEVSASVTLEVEY